MAGRKQNLPGVEAQSKLTRFCAVPGCKEKLLGTRLPRHYKSMTDFKKVEELNNLPKETAERMLESIDKHTAFIFKNGYSEMVLPHWSKHKVVPKPIPKFFQKPQDFNHNDDAMEEKTEGSGLAGKEVTKGNVIAQEEQTENSCVASKEEEQSERSYVDVDEEEETYCSDLINEDDEIENKQTTKRLRLEETDPIEIKEDSFIKVSSHLLEHVVVALKKKRSVKGRLRRIE